MSTVWTDHRGTAWTLAVPFPIKEVWCSAIHPSVVKGWHGDAVTTRAIICVAGRVWQRLADSVGSWQWLIPGHTPLIILPRQMSAVVAAEPSVILYLQDRVHAETQPLTQPITVREEFPNFTDWTSLSARDRA